MGNSDDYNLDVRDLLPNWQTQFAANYEYARESNLFRKSVLERRSESGDKKIDTIELFSNPGSWFPLFDLSEFLALRVPEFPETRWLAIPDDRRRGLLKEIGITPEHFEKLALRYLGSPERVVGADLIGRPVTQGLPVYVFEIDWGESHPSIKEAFEKWLNVHHQNSPPKHTSKGQGGNVRKWRNMLGELGNYRRNKDGYTTKSDPATISRTRTKVKKRLSESFDLYEPEPQKPGAPHRTFEQGLESSLRMRSKRLGLPL